MLGKAFVGGIVCAATILVATVVQADPRRTALVVGVGNYEAVPRLANTATDARSMAQALSRLGFEVETVVDPKRTDLEVAVRRFGARSQNSEAAVFFYAGHALEVGGRNWILPVDAKPTTARDLRFEALDLDALIEQTDGANRTTVLFLDACRDNPFQRRLAAVSRDVGRGGLGQVQASTGTLVAYATAPGNVAADGDGPNSPFTTALLHHIERPGLEVRQMMSAVRREVREATRGAQVPWESSALEGEFFFKPAQNATATPSPPSAAAPDANRRPPSSFDSALHNGLVAWFGDAVPALGPASIEARARRYEQARGFKAQAVGPLTKTTWYVEGRDSAFSAEEAALEGCQVFSGRPCTIVALGDFVRSRPVGRAWDLRDMPRTSFAGSFDPAQIPNLSDTGRRLPHIAGYATAPEPKAAAFHPWGRLFVATAASSQASAEAAALKACNEDPGRKAADGPCYLYARGNAVVLPERRR